MNYRSEQDKQKQIEVADRLSDLSKQMRQAADVMTECYWDANMSRHAKELDDAAYMVDWWASEIRGE